MNTTDKHPCPPAADDISVGETDDKQNHRSDRENIKSREEGRGGHFREGS